MPTEDYSHTRRIARVRQIAEWKGLNKVVGALSGTTHLSMKVGGLVDIQKNLNGIGKTINNGDLLLNNDIPTPPPTLVEVSYDFKECSATVDNGGKITSITLGWLSTKGVVASYKLFWRYNSIPNSGYQSVQSEEVSGPLIIPSDPNLAKIGQSINGNLYQDQSDVITTLTYDITIFNAPAGYDTKRITVYIYAYSDIEGTKRVSNFPKTMLEFVGSPGGSAINKIFLTRTSSFNGSVGTVFVDDYLTQYNPQAAILDIKNISTPPPPPPPPPTSLEVLYDFENCSAILSQFSDSITSITVSWFNLDLAQSYKLFWRYTSNGNSGNSAVLFQQNDGIIEKELSNTINSLYHDQTTPIPKSNQAQTSFTIGDFNPPTDFNAKRITIYIYAYSDIDGTNRLTKFPKTMLQVVKNPAVNDINRMFLSRTSYGVDVDNIKFFDDDSPYMSISEAKDFKYLEQ